ncbi:diaminopimelate epimerase [Psychroflexus planctonicus]|uniref:Diaminopimelate epimerase n=1 Tax=Psychroflexus planctonicus TaxID=1526575 RepID=A0ABQ1SM85_9FLAO|nr:diaminopimelate epimerase [Psychroflexus planctonicus]GGE43842.1 diaminopimelate epimerase [Psychroflexus planctonicus]
MNLTFYKFQGAGNDFIMIDNRELFFKNNTKLIARLCHRRFGIGADGLILLESHPDEEIDFKMVYFNADGNESTLCGNGGRCIVAFAKQLGLIEKQCRFLAIDGLHQAHFEDDLVSLSMPDVDTIKSYNSESCFLDTGSPHHIDFVQNTSAIQVKAEGSRIRNSSLYGKAGSNINFVEVQDHYIKIRTYERGVEDETLACGTGVTAAAIAAHYANKIDTEEVSVKAEGGNLAVRFSHQNGNYSNIQLIGPAEFVFKGEIKC